MENDDNEVFAGAPTATQTSINYPMSLTLQMDWSLAAGDIEAAFPREVERCIGPCSGTYGMGYKAVQLLLVLSGVSPLREGCGETNWQALYLKSR